MDKKRQWRLKNLIKRNKIEFEVGDTVVLFRKKNNGYPKFLEFKKDYTIVNLSGDNITIADPVNIFYSKKYNANLVLNGCMKINKTFIIPKTKLREFNLKKLLG